jgi:hypothetical protein
MTLLVHHLAEYEYLKEHLRAEYQEADEQTILDTLEGLSSLPAALAAVVRSYLDDLALVAAIDIRIGELQERMHRIEHRAEKKRMIVTSIMERAEIRKLAEPDFTASLRVVPPSLLVTDEQQIPEPFWKPQPPKLDKRSLIGALTAGQNVAGAQLGNGGLTLTVRTK